jgi:hypothetical protein
MVRASGGASGPRAQIGRRLRCHDAPNACHSRRMAVPSGSSCRPPRTTSTRRRRLPCDGLAVVRIPRTAISQTVGELTARLRELLEAFLIYPHRDVPGVEPVLRRDGADGAPSSRCDRRRADRAAGEGSVFESGIHSCMDGYPVAGGATAPWRAGEPGFGHTRVGLSLSGRPGPLTALPGAGVAPIRALAPVRSLTPTTACRTGASASGVASQLSSWTRCERHRRPSARYRNAREKEQRGLLVAES